MNEIILKAILKAGNLLMERFGKEVVIRTKAHEREVVSEADLASEKVILDAIRLAYPHHGICSEESPATQMNSEFVWYVDPLDGTRNFVTRVPIFGISVSLTRNGIPIWAALYMPATGEFCTAEAGKNAYLNGRKMMCSLRTEWRSSYGVGPVLVGTKQKLEFEIALANISGGTAWMTAVGCAVASEVWVADGRRDWYFSTGKNAWDYLGASLIAKEAGCTISDIQGNPWKAGSNGFVASTPALYPDLLRILKQSYPQISG